MQENARTLKARGIEVVIDPGQGLPLFQRDELRELVDGASIFVANDYEWALTLERTGWEEAEVARRTGAIVTTFGERGSRILEGERELQVPAVRAAKVVDPTGCGDAYRAGMLYARARGLPLETACRLGSLLGALKAEVVGPQGLRLDRDALRSRFVAEFGAPLA
jgi:adenosine kinase